MTERQSRNSSDPIRILGHVLWYGWCVLLLCSIAFLPGLVRSRSRAPSATRAQFEQRHRISYDVYAMRDESSAYDLLAQTFTGRELDRQFVDLAQGQTQTRKAKADVMVWDVLYQDFKILESRGSRCRVYCKWNVVFVLGHKSHSHVRSNAYEAHFDMEYANGEWRIAESRILSRNETG